jgi:hypothetical protein
MPRVLNDALPVDRYLAISAECVACDCGAGETIDDDEIDAPVPGRRVVSPRRGGVDVRGR